VCFYSNTYNGFTAVAFQFSCIGNSPGATQLLTELNRIDPNQDPKIRECVDGFLVGSDLESQLADKWFMVCHYRLFPELVNGSSANLISAAEKQLPKILLGAILPSARPPHP